MMEKKRQLIVINIFSVIALLIILCPLLLIAQYDYPSADDWSFSVYSYHAINNGEGVLGALGGVIKAIKQFSANWEGRFSISLLGALQPGIWGEKFYGIVPWIMIGSIIVSEIFLCKYCCGMLDSKKNRWYYLPIIVPVLIMQILYTPSPIESFYWYNGAVNYTFVYGLSLILLVLFFRMGRQTCTGWKYALTAVGAVALAILVGGDNFATSLSSLLALCIMFALFFRYQRKAFYRTWFVPLIIGIALLLCIFAPGNANRLNSNFGGTTGGIVDTVIMSLVRSATNIYSWTNSKILLMLLFILPFIWMAVKNLEFKFPVPALFTLITFGLYASQITATMYVDGTTGGGRMAAILYYSYVIWMVGNVFYWAGWLSKKENKVRRILDGIGERFGKFVIVYCGVIGVVLVAVIYLTDLREISSYRAYRDWRQGWAQQYAVEWDARLETLHNDSVTEVEFAPLSVHPEMLEYTDLQDESGYYWVNEACAQYYGKISIDIVTENK